MPDSYELNLDGLVGPTHSYAGLSYGNLASQRNRREASNPRQAALQGLAKMKLLADLGLKQAVLPPQERPDVYALRRLGFSGSDAAVIERAAREHPAFLAACCSASAMWAANAATVSPGADTDDGLVHFTPANLLAQLHRSLESRTTARVLRAIFRDEAEFAHHLPLPAAAPFADEGAANHTRLCPDYGRRGLEIFVYGKSVSHGDLPGPFKYPARQTREAGEAVARLHGLRAGEVLFLQQNSAAIDAGAFHNDVVAVGNLNVLLYHEVAFAGGAAAVEKIRRAYRDVSGGGELFLIEATEQQVPLADAVGSYLFNSQLVELPEGGMCLIAPAECVANAASRLFIDELIASDNPVGGVQFADLRQSMRNGGGPACLRLRVALTGGQLAAVNEGVLLTDALLAELTAWVGRHYRDQLHPDDLADPNLLTESRAALDELTRLLGVGAIYRFQGAGDG